ncbi:MAG: SIS domain-containing protein [Gemmatimonadetes bacterium]|nr:SIS domain-containing protein [Gemmatimonadota bacterium]
MTFTLAFLSQTARIAQSLDADRIERMAVGLARVRDQGGRVFFIGVGGGAGHASHAVCDFRKLGHIECYAPTDNVSELTARINDEGWETSYSEWLAGSRLSGKDAIFVFSVGGGNQEKGVSRNLVSALNHAKQVGAAVFGVVGRDGGHTAAVGDVVLVIPTVDHSLVTPHVEGFQAIVWHLLVSHPAVARQTTKWEAVTGAVRP